MNKINKLIVLAIIILNLILVTSLFAQTKVTGKIVKSAFWNGREVKFVANEVIVKLTPSTLSSQIAPFLSKWNATIKTNFDKLGWGLIELPAVTDELHFIAELKKIPFVSTAELNIVVKAFLEPNDPYFKGTSPATYAYQWALDNTRQSPPSGVLDADIDASEAWDITTGSSNVILAILDSGIPMINGALSHPDLDDPNKIILGSDFIFDGESVRDRSGHGTHVAGIAAAETNNGTGIAGIAQNCKILVIQVFDENGYATLSSIYNGIKEAVNYQINHPGTKVVINYSGGATSPSQVYIDAIIYAASNGVPIVVAAGNENGGSVNYPAAYSTSYSNVIAVSATNQNDLISTYSSKGPEITVAAPGGNGGDPDDPPDSDDIFSTTPNYPFTLEVKDITQNYGYLSGTSMAAPQVTGTIGLMLSVNSSLSATQIRDILQQNADDKGPAGFDNEYGYGRLNSLKSVANAYVLANPQYQYYVESASISLHSTDYDMTFLSDPTGGVSAGRYRCDRYIVQGTKGGFSQTPNGWMSGALGYSWSNPNDAKPHVIKSTTNNSITLQTVFYYLKNNIDTGQPVNKWAPFDPNLGTNSEFVTLGVSSIYNITFQNNFISLGNIGNIKVNSTVYTSPTDNFTVIDGGTINATAINQTLNNIDYTFSNWSMGSTNITETFYPTANTTYTANFIGKPNFSNRSLTFIGGPGTPRNPAKVQLSWNEHPNTNITQYKIWRKVKHNGVMGDPSLIATVNRGTTTYTVPDNKRRICKCKGA